MVDYLTCLKPESKRPGRRQITEDKINRIKELLSDSNNSVSSISKIVHSDEKTVRRVGDGYYDR